MQHSKSTFIDLKLRLVIAFLFISFHSVFSQSSVLIGNAVHQDGKAVSGAYIFINKQDSKILTNNAGCFTLTVNPRDTITIVDAVTNDYYIIPEKHSDTIVYTFILTEKSYNIEEINVSANRLEHISGDFNEYIIDYYVFETGSIALLKSYKNKYYLTFQNASKEKQDFELPFVPKEFYLDCVENMHIVSKDSTYQFWIDTSFHIVQVLSNKYVKANLKSLVYCGEKEYVYFDISDYNRKYRLNLRDEISTTTFMEVFDTIGYYNIIGQIAKLNEQSCAIGKPCYKGDVDSRISRTIPLKYQYLKNSQNYGGTTYGSKEANYSAYANSKGYANYTVTRSTSINYPSPITSSSRFNDGAFIQHQINVPIKIQSFSINQSIISIDLSNDNIKVFNLKGKEIHSARINQNDHSKNEIIKDPYGKKFYLFNKNKATLDLSLLDIQNGNYNAILSLKEVNYPEKIKVFNNQLYFIAANEHGFHKLYTLNLFLGE